MGYLFLIFMDPLAGDLDGDPSLRVDVADTCLRLQIGMLLIRQVVLAFDDDLGRGPAGSHVTFANAIMLENVAAVPGMEDDFILHRLTNIRDKRPLLPFDPDECARTGRGGFRLGDDDGHMIAFPEADVCVRVGAAQPDQNRLVGHDQAIFIARHVAGRQNEDHARHSLRFARVHRQHSGMGLAAEKHATVEQIAWVQIAGIGGRAFHFGVCIDPVRYPCAKNLIRHARSSFSSTAL